MKVREKWSPVIFQPMSSETNHKHLCFYSQMEGFLSDLQAVCEFQEPILFRSSEKGATMCNEQIGSVLLTKDQIDPTSTLTAYLEDKNFDSGVPKSINNTNWQYRLYPKNLSWGVLASKLQVWGRVMLSAFFFPYKDWWQHHSFWNIFSLQPFSSKKESRIVSLTLFCKNYVSIKGESAIAIFLPPSSFHKIFIKCFTA